MRWRTFMRDGVLERARRSLTDPRRTGDIVFFFCVILAVSLWVVLHFQLETERARVIDSTMKANTNLARAFAEHVTRTIRGADIALLQIKTQFEKSGMAFDLAEYVRERGIHAQPYRSLTVSDPAGEVILSSVPTKPINVGDREHFQVHARGETRGLFISKPEVGRSSGKWSIFLTRAITKPNGDFGGVATIALDPGYFTRFYNEIDLGADGTIVLAGRDGIVRARQSNREVTAGQDLSQLDLYTKMLLASEFGSYRVTSSVDGVARIISYRALKDYPLVVLVGESEASALAAYGQRRGAYLWWAGVATAFILCFGFVVTRQLTHQARINERLRESESRFRDLAELSSDWFWEQDASLRFTHMSAELYPKATLNPAVTIGKLRWELPIEGVSETQWRAHQELLQRHEPFHDFTYQMRNEAGELRWFSINGKPLFGPTGEFTGYRGTGRDITERKLTEEARFQLAAIVESSRDAIISRALDGTIMSWNAGAERLFGYAASEVIGRKISMIMPAGHEADAQEHSRLLLEGGRIPPTEVVRRTRDGSLITVLRSISPVKNSAGEIVGAAIIVHDISERKRAENELAKLNAELEERVAQRTADLKIAYEELESFSYSVSHDLRAPLRAINGFAAIVLRDSLDKLDPLAADYLQRIQANGERMGELIDDMLNLTRVSRQVIRRQDFDLSALAASVIAALAEAHPGRRVEAIVQPQMRTNADRGLLQIVLENLIGNAWKFTANAQAARIEVGSEQRAGETAFYVRDNGAGFDMEYAHKLFVPFQRLHGNHEFEGTGIGLSIVKRILVKHGGKVWAESTVGQGATFYFTLG